MLKEQRLVLDHDTKGTMRLYNTYDISEEAQIAKELASESKGTVKTGDMEIMPLGHIPQDMWMWNPWLMQADKARVAGDMGEFTKNLQKFFELFPVFKSPFIKKYY